MIFERCKCSLSSENKSCSEKYLLRFAEFFSIKFFNFNKLLIFTLESVSFMTASIRLCIQDFTNRVITNVKQISVK